jgi:hypothetical protein
MNVEADQLPGLQYRPFAELEHAQLGAFMKDNIRPGTPVSTGYWLLNAALAGFIGLQLVRQNDAPLAEVLCPAGPGLLRIFRGAAPPARTHPWPGLQTPGCQKR